jgi:hypothetical protein
MSNATETKHTPTPWPSAKEICERFGVPCDPRGYLSGVDYERARKCVNACAADGPVMIALRYYADLYASDAAKADPAHEALRALGT